MPNSIAGSAVEVGQRFQEMRKATRQWEVESFFTDSRSVRHVCLRDILDPSRRVTLACSALMDRARFRPLEVRLRRSL
ncbi:MAG: hypothetical protein Tsb0032_14410 [Kiloniellaceae bacterium]